MRELFYERANGLAAMPFMCRHGRVAGTREAVVHPNCIMIYAVTDTEVRILSVIHARQNYP